MVEPPKRRKRKNSPSDRARDARKLMERIEERTAERHETWADGGRAVDRLSTELDDLHTAKRVMRREVYAEAPQLEGAPVFKGTPGGRS